MISIFFVLLDTRF